MLNMRKLFKRQTSTEGQLSGPNPTGEELAELRADAIARNAERIQQEATRQKQRKEAIARAIGASRVYVHQHEVSGEVPIITEDMEQPGDGADAQNSATQEVDTQELSDH